MSNASGLPDELISAKASSPAATAATYGVRALAEIAALREASCADVRLLDDLTQLLEHGLITEPFFNGCVPLCEICSTPASQADYIFFNLVLSGCLLPLLGILGLFGNAMSAFVYSRKECRSSTNLYLCALGCSDSAVIVTAIFLFGVEAYRKYSLHIYTVFAAVSPIVYPMGLAAQTCSVYFTLVAGADCFVQTCMSTRVRSFISRPRTVRWAVVVVVVFSIAYNIPHCFESVVIRCFHDRFSALTFELCPDPLRFNELYSIIYYKYMYSIFVAVGPLVCLILMNISIITASVLGHSSSNTGDTIALVLVVLLFIMCNTAALLLNIFEQKIAEDLGEYFNYIVDLSNIMVVFNSSFNFVIYVTFSTTFRRTLLRYICGGATGREPLKELVPAGSFTTPATNGTGGSPVAPPDTDVLVPADDSGGGGTETLLGAGVGKGAGGGARIASYTIIRRDPTQPQREVLI